MFRPGILVYILAVGTAVVGFKLYANSVNQIGSFFAGNELQEYFGPLVDRLDLRSWRRIVKILATQILNPVTLLLGVVGLLAYPRANNEYKSLYLGLTLGSVTALLTFFNRYTWHNYYQLPLVFPLVFLAGYGAFRIHELLGGFGRRFALYQNLFLALVTALTLFYTAARYPELTETPTEWIASNGTWIQEHSQAGDFVVYILETRDFEDWNPVFLYFAKRDGYNLPMRRVKPRVLANLYTRYAPHYARFLIFCPASLHDTLWKRLESLDATLFEAGPNGILYRLEKPPVS
jgi:hypothetical protein